MLFFFLYRKLICGNNLSYIQKKEWLEPGWWPAVLRTAANIATFLLKVTQLEILSVGSSLRANDSIICTPMSLEILLVLIFSSPSLCTYIHSLRSQQPKESLTSHGKENKLFGIKSPKSVSSIIYCPLLILLSSCSYRHLKQWHLGTGQENHQAFQ